uniref:GNAT family N-acetyltransferase n=1 Tax=Phenylobacterium glaciei TaxID=2803784 RepID=A0A974P406_9CAUL|nr:GNAT family N-acetyltransferase [Phenylobacterium glaciei]
MEIRVLKAGDEALLMAAVDHLAEEGPLTQQAATRHLADTDLVSVVALEDQVPVGFVYGHVLRRFEKTSFFIYAVDVDEAFQRRGSPKPCWAPSPTSGARAAGTRCLSSPTPPTRPPWPSTPAPAASATPTT